MLTVAVLIALFGMLREKRKLKKQLKQKHHAP
jgi:hypothetical protein